MSGERDLLEAVLEAISLPLPATYGDTEKYQELLTLRLGNVRAVLRDAFHEIGGLTGDPEWLAGYLRKRTAELPAEGYKSGLWPGVPVEELPAPCEHGMIPAPAGPGCLRCG